MRVLASSQNWIEGSAIQQLEKTAGFPGMKLAVGLPDLHPGKGSPIGAAFAAEGWLYPTLVGNDVGCGIGLWQTSLSGKKCKREVLAERLQGLDDSWDGDASAWLSERALASTGYENCLGTIGGGNHFAELQTVERVEDGARFTALGLTAEQVFLLVHSGSRGFGEAILREHVTQFGFEGLAEGGRDAEAYRLRHDQAMAWAKANRELIAKRMLDCLRGDGAPILDICHNSVEARDFDGKDYWLHRKGAAPSTEGAVVIPGSRGAFSYLVVPKNVGPASAFSLAHGAGRKWSRTDSRARLEKRYTAKDLTRTELGSHVICEDKQLLYEEAPQAYKNITIVVDDLVRAGLIDVIAVLRPQITYKVRR